MKDFWKKQEKPILALSPMEGWTDTAMRRIVKKVNPNVVTFTEFTSVDGIYHAPNKTKKRLEFNTSERPIIAQIYGKKKEAFLHTIKICEEMGFDGIDLNMGCPAKKVVKSEQGVVLRRKHYKAFKLIELVAKNTDLPVSVKTRLGWNDASDLIEFGKGAEDAGADLISIHARTYKEPYGCDPHYEPVYNLKKELNIPVIGNGGITSLKQGMKYLKNLDGIMIGQGAMGNPWVFIENQPKTFKEKVPIIKMHVELLLSHYGEKVGLLNIRKHLLSYVKGMEGASKYRMELATSSSKDQIYSILDRITE